MRSFSCSAELFCSGVSVPYTIRACEVASRSVAPDSDKPVSQVSAARVLQWVRRDVSFAMAVLPRYGGSFNSRVTIVCTPLDGCRRLPVLSLEEIADLAN